jgi:hypothetical protein
MSVSTDAASGNVLETRESLAKAMLVSYERVDITSADTGGIDVLQVGGISGVSIASMD